MARQYFAEVSAEAPIANLAAVTATTETALWNPAQYTPIRADEARPGKLWRVTACGIMSFASTGTLTITPRFGLTVGAGITMGASVVVGFRVRVSRRRRAGGEQHRHWRGGVPYGYSIGRVIACHASLWWHARNC